MQLYLQSRFVEKPSLKSLLQFTSLPFSCEEAPLWQHSWGDIGIILPVPPVNAMPSKNGFTPHVLRDGGCFHFYPLLNGKNCATDILRTDECDWGWLVAKSEAMSERTERRVKRTGCAVKEPNLTAFWVCEWKLQTSSSPNMDISLISTSRFFFF